MGLRLPAVQFHRPAHAQALRVARHRLLVLTEFVPAQSQDGQRVGHALMVRGGPQFVQGALARPTGLLGAPATQPGQGRVHPRRQLTGPLAEFTGEPDCLVQTFHRFLVVMLEQRDQPQVVEYLAEDGGVPVLTAVGLGHPQMLLGHDQPGALHRDVAAQEAGAAHGAAVAVLLGRLGHRHGRPHQLLPLHVGSEGRQSDQQIHRDAQQGHTVPGPGLGTRAVHAGRP